MSKNENKTKKFDYKTLIICVIISAFIGAIVSAAVISFIPKSEAAIYEEFYTSESLVSISPADFVYDYKNGKVDGLVVDLRASADYAKGHLVTAVNIPAVEMREQEVINAFSSLPKDKPIITYCYSGYCMLSRHVGKALADNGIYVKHFTAGWYEIQRDLNAFTTNESGQQITGSNNALVCSANPTGDFTC